MLNIESQSVVGKLLTVLSLRQIVTGRINEGGNAIASVRVSVRPLSFHFMFGIDWPLTLNICMWISHDHSSQGIGGQGHRSRSRSLIKLMRSVRSRSMAVFFLILVRYSVVASFSSSKKCTWTTGSTTLLLNSSDRIIRLEAVSYTHLTLPTNREV